MRQEDIWDQEAAQAYDTPGTGMFAPEMLGPAVDRLAGLAGDGPALEFAIGTGRVAIPLAERGVPVTGIELSRPMIEQLRTKAGEAAIPVIVGDMATARAPGAYTLVYLVFTRSPTC
jgi:16S rRNA A1518/A1519 N6-dimethyltransferase RsmA/KsgA/DIM1 with predicted DNA glycosylase/AP lyase activity